VAISHTWPIPADSRSSWRSLGSGDSDRERNAGE
jgi:hypothetical protein